MENNFVPNLRSMNIGQHYEGLGSELATNVIIPAMNCCARFDRLTSYFNVESLIACAAGIDDLWRRECKFRLVLGIHAIPPELVSAASSSAWVDELLKVSKARLIEECSQLTEELEKNKIGALAMMLRSGFLEVRVACPRSSIGILHSKRYLFTDSNGEVLVAIGSPNETRAGHSDNFEEITVHTSWEDGHRTMELVKSFENIWEGKRFDLIVRSLDAEFADELLRAIGIESSRDKPEHRLDDTLKKILNLIQNSPEFAFANVARAALFPHQERALRDAASRWPIRVLLADEVGLGKTIEAGSLVAYAKKFLGVKRILVLTPAGLRQQWQAELNSHFGISAWLFDSETSSYISPIGQKISANKSDPLSFAPDIILVSWQLARGSWRDNDIFKNSDWKPDLVLVDEAHSARRSRGIDKKIKTTLVWELVKDLGTTIPHLILLTATPMQIQVEEYHGLLMLLGMPQWWLDSDKFIKLLQYVSRFDDNNELSPTKHVADGVAAGLQMTASPSFRIHQESGLNADEIFPPPLKISQILSLTSKGKALKKLAITATPPALLTVRNTRRGLESIGYTFPKRIFHTPKLNLSDLDFQFLRSISSYLDDAYGKVEQSLGLSDGGASAFVKSIYLQRLVSSRLSATRTLNRRAERLKSFLSNGIWTGNGHVSDDLDTDYNEESQALHLIRDDYEAAQQHAKIELQFITEMSISLDQSCSTSEDPKISAVKSIIRGCIAAGDSVLVFSRFTDTVDACVDASIDYLRETSTGFGRYSGGESWAETGSKRINLDKNSLCRELRQKNIRVIFCSDAASEGLNLQAARCIINVDVPWNPARLEQRIGRIARLGQKAAEVAIYNLWYPGTVEEQMYSRLLSRQDLYNLAVGEFPDVIGDTIRRQLKTGDSLDFSEVENSLNDLRAKAEFGALERIWSRTVDGRSVGAQFREALQKILGNIVERKGGTVTRNGTNWIIQFANSNIQIDSQPGQPESLHLNHDAVKFLHSPTLVGPIDQNTQKIHVLLCENTPIALVIKGQNRYHIQGAVETLSLIDILISDNAVTSLGPEISEDPTSFEVLNALRLAFPSRIELGDVVVPNALNPNYPEVGDFSIVPINQWQATF